MVKLRREFIIATLVLSSISTLLCMSGLGTKYWIVGSAVLTDRVRSELNYGLFAGSLLRHHLATALEFELILVCDFGEGACIQSCQRNRNQRQDELKRILKGIRLQPCEQRGRSFENLNWNTSDHIHFKNKNSDNVEYMPAGLWICTVIFCTFFLALNALSIAFAILNLYTNPIERIFNVFGLYIWNGGATVSSALGILFWVLLYNIHLRRNVAVTDTLRNEMMFSSDGLAYIGYSFYLILGAGFLNIINLVLLYLRQHLTPKNKRHSIIINNIPLEFY